MSDEKKRDRHEPINQTNKAEQNLACKAQRAESQNEAINDLVTGEKTQFQHEHRLLRDFLNHNPSLSFIKDEQGRYLYANRSFFEFFKINEEDVIGKTDFDWLPENVARQFTQNDQFVRSSGKVLETIESVDTPNGAIRSLVHKFPINDRSGRTLIGGVATDMTERLRLEDLQAELAAIVDSSHDAIIATVEDGTIRTWNSGAQTMFGYTPGEIIGKNLKTILASNYAEESTKIDQSLRKELALDRYESCWQAKDGHSINVSVVVSAIQPREGKITGLSIVARDITGRIEMEQALRKTSAELSYARDQAIEASALKSAFVSNISHELRTPLAGIIGMIELLMHTKLNQDQHSMAKTIDECSQSLLSLVNDILDLSKIEAGKVTSEIQPFNLIFVVQDCARLLAAEAREKDVMLRTNVDHRIPDFVIGDQKRVRQILLNLVGNSIKFTESGEISVEALVETLTEQAIEVRFSVKDTGIGISQAEQELLFKPFSQVDNSSTRKYQGSGLGLYITKQLVEVMGGTIQLESRKGIGTQCWFSLSFERYGLDKQAAELPPAFEQPSLDLKDCQVLLVEDIEMIQKVVLKQLESFGISAQAVFNGQEAIELACAFSFDLILMDCQMPVCDGFQATKAIRELDSKFGRHTPIIALTAGAMQGDREKCLAAGMDDYLSKPVTIHELEQKVEHWLTLKQSKQD